MSKIFMFLVILISIDGMLCMSINGTIGDTVQERETTEKNFFVELVKQHFLKEEELKRNNSDIERSSASETLLIPGSKLGSYIRVAISKEDVTVRPKEYNTDSTNRGTSTANTKLGLGLSTKALTKDSDNTQHASEHHGRTFEAHDAQNPIGYAMRIAAEIIENEMNKTFADDFANYGNENATQRIVFEGDRNIHPTVEVVTEGQKLLTDGTIIEEEKEAEEAITTMDPVDEEIQHVLDTLPKLPEMPLSDNNTEFVFHKDPEEEALDERITQLARQLAETSLRREFEEKKLGHYIPIRLRQFDEIYDVDSFTPRRFNTAKSFKNPFEIFWGIHQEPQLNFKPLPLPQGSYNGPYFLPNELPSQSSTESDDISYSAEPVYATQTDNYKDQDGNANVGSTGDVAILFQMGPRYVIPTSRNTVARSRIPLFFDIAPREYSPVHNQDNVNRLPYRK